MERSSLLSDGDRILLVIVLYRLGNFLFFLYSGCSSFQVLVLDELIRIRQHVVLVFTHVVVFAELLD